MDLTEAQAKNVLRSAGISVPLAVSASSPEQAQHVYADSGMIEAVVKAQIRAGDRATGYFVDSHVVESHTSATHASAHDPRLKSGSGIQFVSTADEVASASAEMLGNILVTSQTGPTGEYVGSVYIESNVPVTSEFYLALTIDRDLGGLTFLASRFGGSGVESRQQNQIHRYPVDINTLDVPKDILTLFANNATQSDQIARLATAVLTTFVEKDASLIELNPFGYDAEDKLTVLDARVVWDDNAIFRQGHEEQMHAYDHLSEPEFKAVCLGMNYIKLDGSIATLATGAGLAMATLDALHDAGGQAANFFDLAPSSTVAEIVEALSIIRMDEKVTALMINVIGGGIMRCDAIVDAILLSHERNPITTPMVIRLAGTNADVAMQRLQSSIPGVAICTDLATAARTATDVHNEIKQQHSAQAAVKKPWWRRAKKSSSGEQPV